MKKIIFNVLALFSVILVMSACTDNDPKYSITLPGDGEFVLSASDSVLALSSTDASTHTAITFAWDSLTYGISTPVNYTIQIDTLGGDFSNPVEEEAAEGSYSISYTDSVFNKKMLNLLKLTGGEESKIIVRLKASLEYDNYPVYSNVLTLKVTPYVVEKTVSFLYMPGVVGGDWNDFSVKLCSKENDGNYEGYVSADEWANFNFTDKNDGTGTYYGSSPSSLYVLDSGDDKWNIWFDEGGYFLVKADLNNMTWSKTAVTSFAVTGEFNSWSITSDMMTYDATNHVWTATLNISTVLYGIQIIGNQDWNFKYGDTDQDGSLVLGGDNIVVSDPGTYKLTMDLSNPEKYTYTLEKQ